MRSMHRLVAFVLVASPFGAVLLATWHHDAEDGVVARGVVLSEGDTVRDAVLEYCAWARPGTDMLDRRAQQQSLSSMRRILQAAGDGAGDTLIDLFCDSHDFVDSLNILALVSLLEPRNAEETAELLLRLPLSRAHKDALSHVLTVARGGALLKFALDMSTSDDEDSRFAAVQYLRRRKEESAVEAVCDRLLRDSSVPVRLDCALIVPDPACPRRELVVETLVRALDDEHVDVRKNAKYSLLQVVEGEEWIPVLQRDVAKRGHLKMGSRWIWRGEKLVFAGSWTQRLMTEALFWLSSQSPWK